MQMNRSTPRKKYNCIRNVHIYLGQTFNFLQMRSPPTLGPQIDVGILCIENIQKLARLTRLVAAKELQGRVGLGMPGSSQKNIFSLKYYVLADLGLEMSGPWGPWGLHGLQGAAEGPKGPQKAKRACYGARGTLVFVPNDYPGISLNDRYQNQFGGRGGVSVKKLW